MTTNPTEPTNDDRADWARVAAGVYAAATRHNPHELLAIESHLAGTGTPDGHESSVEVISDLLCDLHHLADRLGLDWDRLLDLGDLHHTAERIESFSIDAGNRSRADRECGPGIDEPARGL